jgi:hypothetical protein
MAAKCGSICFVSAAIVLLHREAGGAGACAQRGVSSTVRRAALRQLWDSKGSALIDLMAPRTMDAYAKLCGQALARAHARSGDAVAISSYLGTSDTFDQALAVFAEAYADQNERDYAALQAAAHSGRIEVQTGL